MITFKQFLSEDNGDSGFELVKLIQTKCAPFLKAGNFTPMFRGEKSRKIHFDRDKTVTLLDFDGKPHEVSYAEIKHFNGEREPQDLSKSLHDWFGNRLKQEFGWNPRNSGLFVTGSFSQASNYSPVFMIFPVGDFQFVYSSKTSDLYVYLQNTGSYRTLSANPQENAEVLDRLYQELRFSNKHFEDALKSKHEISLRAESYILIPATFFNAQVRIMDAQRRSISETAITANEFMDILKTLP